MVDKYSLKRIRKGKTARDHASGSWKQRFANQEARAHWQKTDFADAEAANKAFPGRKN